ncbi:MAG: sigma-70 family RNA polymerase sigma factor [Longimicrobiales bacterium]
MSEPLPDSSDGDLYARMRAGDERALSELYDRHAERMYSLARSVCSDPADAEEAVADAFLRLWRAGDFDPDRGTVGTFLAVVTRSRALDRVRARKRRGRAEEKGAAQDPQGFAVEISAAGDPPERRVELAEKRGRIREALATLSDKQQAVIDLAYFGGMTHREIAEHLTEPLGTVKTRLRDGMQKLRDAFPLTRSAS